MLIRINVTQEDIEAPCEPFGRTNTCMVARAINRVLKDDCYASVDYTWIALYAPSRTEILVPAADLGYKIVRYDHGLHLDPFSFWVEIPKDMIRNADIGKEREQIFVPDPIPMTWPSKKEEVEKVVEPEKELEPAR